MSAWHIRDVNAEYCKSLRSNSEWNENEEVAKNERTDEREKDENQLKQNDLYLIQWRRWKQ